MIVLYKGRRGSGKTLTMTKDALKFYQKGWRILRNFDLPFGEYMENEEITNLDKDSDIRDAVILIDEIQIFFDSKNAFTKQSKKFANFIQQVRKRNIVILATTQRFIRVDKSFREHVDVEVMPEYIEDLQVCYVVYQDMTVLESIVMFNEKPPTVEIVFDARPIFNLYKTDQLIA